MTEAEDNRPEWMVELENRKRKPRLAHEAGAGSPCLSCKEACPGLDLHFWRKICKNCKCARDEHDVVDDEFPQFDLLLGPSGKPRRKAFLLPVAIKKQPEKENAFEWIPPDVSTEIAADYMKALPENKLPIQGSEGAALRKQQLQKQLPLHDMDHKACDKLSEQEQQQFEKYLENLKKYVGQGKVSKIMGARPFNKSLMTPANAADMQPMSPLRYTPGDLTNLRTPSSFIPKVSGPPATQGYQIQQTWLAGNIEAIQSQIGDNANSTGVRLGQYHPALDNVSVGGQVANSETVNSNRYPAQHFANTARITETQRNMAEFLRNPENANFIPDYGKVNYNTEYSQAGEHFEPNAAPKSVTPLVDSNVNCNRNHYAANQQIANLENISVPRNFSQGSPAQTGQYHNANLPLSQASESRVQSENPGILNLNYSGPHRHLGDEKSQNSSEMEALQNVSHSDTVSLTSAELAEQMLSDALLPPSSVHTNEIIGSTLDRNKLKFIQEKLSAKYSKDDSPSQKMLKSQLLDTADPQYGQIIGKNKNLQAHDSPLDKEANRIAIIAAMRNPSGLLADNEMLDKVRAEYSNPLEPSGQNRYPGYDKDTGLQKEHSAVPQQGLREPQDFTKPLEMGGDRSRQLDQLHHHPTQHRYLDNMQLPAVSDQQQQAFNVRNYPPPDQEHLTNYPMSQDPATTQQNYPGNKEWNLRNPSTGSNPMNFTPTEQIKAELTHQPFNSHVIHSQSSGNPSFPEGIIDSPGLRQNPASVDQLRGALEELSVEPIQLHKCTQCKEEINSGDVVVTAERAKDAVWHPGCFICSTCNELLVDLVYFYHKGKLYCGRDLATLLNIPRCFACDELIFVREYTVAEGHNYHIKHFCCWDCDIPLAGQQYISENDRPLCLPCFQKTYAKTCRTCSKVIRADQQGVAVKNLDFHADEECFCCFTCKKSLLSGKMAIKEERPFCSKECITEFLNK